MTLTLTLTLLVIMLKIISENILILNTVYCTVMSVCKNCHMGRGLAKKGSHKDYKMSPHRKKALHKGTKVAKYPPHS